MSVIRLIDSYTKESVNYEETSLWYDGTPMDDTKVDNIIYRKKSGKYYVDTDYLYNSKVNVCRFGADKTGQTDSTLQFQNAFNLANKLYRTAADDGNGYIYFTIPEVIIPSGIYKVGTINIYSRVKITGCGQSVIISNTGTESAYSNYFVNNSVTNIEVENLTFLYFDTVFRIPTGNVDFSFITFRKCNVAACNLFIDTVGYNESRSTSLLIERCIGNYKLKQFGKIYTDKLTVRENWFTTSENTKFFEVDSFAHFYNNVWVPSDNTKIGSRCYIYFSSSDDARGLLFTNERFGGEAGQTPIVVVGQQCTKSSPQFGYKNMGITFNNCHLNCYNQWNPDGITGGDVRAAVILEEPIFEPSGGVYKCIDYIKFESCKISPNIKAVSTYNAPNFKSKVHPEFTIEFDSISSLSVIRGLGFHASNDLQQFVKKPINNKNTELLNKDGKPIKALDTTVTGMKKISFKVNRLSNVTPPIPYENYAVGISYLATFIGQGDSSYPNRMYGYSSTYILTISGGYDTSGRSKITTTKLAGDTGGAALQANADIISAHFGIEETGNDTIETNTDTVSNVVDITITFGTRMQYGWVILTPLFDFDLRD